jgi:hypothetical protein
MGQWLQDFWEGPLSFASIYGAAIALVVLWAMVMLTRRLRVTQSEVAGLRDEVRLINETIKMLTTGLRDSGRPMELGRPTMAPPGPQPAPYDLPPMPPDEA